MGNSQSATSSSNPQNNVNLQSSFKVRKSIENKDNSDKIVTRMTRSPSGADIFDQQSSNFVPIEKLSKILTQISQDKYGISGIVEDVFVNKVFMHYPDLGHRLFKHLHTSSKATTTHLGQTAFRQQCERFLSVLEDSLLLEHCVKMYSDLEQTDIITADGFRTMLRTCFELTINHQPIFEETLKTSELNKICPMIEKTLNTVMVSCFFSKDYLSTGFVCRWLEQNCPKLVPPIYKYCAFILTSAYRGVENLDKKTGLELRTPILEKDHPFESSNTESQISLLPLSVAWLLASALDILYTKPISVQNSSSTTTSTLVSQVFMAKMLSIPPTHWVLLYNSMTQGIGANRFLHHVLGYKGPNIVLIAGNDDNLFCIASPGEWKETHMYFGGENCYFIQLRPKFTLIEKGSKMLYLNTIIRGYPKGLRCGKDPKKPLISVDEHFEKFEYRGVPFKVNSIEVWGCGESKSRTVQLDIKKWQFKEAERQRTVKLTAADWMDHPDRYLLELGGRSNYNSSAN